MYRRHIFQKTKEFIKGKWLKYAAILMLIWFINFTLGLIMGYSSFIQMIMLAVENLEFEGSAELLIKLDSFNQGGLIAVLITGFVSTLLNGGFMMSLLKSVQTNTSMKLKDVLKTSGRFVIPIAIISLTMAIINSFLSFIPSIAPILQLMISYMLIFSEFILFDDNTQDALVAMKKSTFMTRGFKLEMFNVALMYMMRPYAGLLLVYVGLFLMPLSLVAGIAVAVLGFIVYIGLYFLYIPYAKVSTALFYEKIKEIKKEAV